MVIEYFWKGVHTLALFGEALVQEITALVQQRQQTLSTLLGVPSSPIQIGEQSPLRDSINLLIRVANGEYLRAAATATMLRQVETASETILDALLGNTFDTSGTIPDDIWQRDIGILISRVRWWIYADDVITISNAAALAFGENTQANRMRIVRAMDKGLLQWVPDPSVANPQQNRRVLRPQVERLRDQRRLPE